LIPTEKVDQTILDMWLLSKIQQNQDRGHTEATCAVLGLNGRLSVEDDPFIEWMKKLSGPKTIEDAKNSPFKVLLHSQLDDLIRKVIVSVGFYATSHLTLYITLSSLLSRSQTVSKIAQPLLDQIPSIPIPHPLQSARVIAFAPVIVKLLHMALLVADPMGKNNVLRLLQ